MLRAGAGQLVYTEQERGNSLLDKLKPPCSLTRLVLAGAMAPPFGSCLVIAPACSRVGITRCFFSFIGREARIAAASRIAFIPCFWLAACCPLIATEGEVQYKLQHAYLAV
ncbi:hypothetical protein F4678DRAFT_266887 [Xylaria arbuscula]|nr:hypothetical protein F4678DRAFT_266887 [Xylaria arbuscula]